MSQENIKTLGAFVETFNDRDFDDALQYLDRAVEIYPGVRAPDHDSKLLGHEGWKEFIRVAIEGGGDPGGAAFDTGVFADDSEWVLAPEAFGEVPVYRGRDGFKKFFRDFTEDLAEWSMSLERLIDAGDDLVVAILRQRATGKASGVPVEWQMGVVYELEGSRVIRMTNYDSEAEALEAAGLSE